MTMGETIRHYRKKSGYTQMEFAAEADIAVNSLRLYERDKRQPSIDTLRRFSDILNIDMNILLGRDGNAVNPEAPIDFYLQGALKKLGYRMSPRFNHSVPQGFYFGNSSVGSNYISLEEYVELRDQIIKAITQCADQMAKLAADRENERLEAGSKEFDEFLEYVKQHPEIFNDKTNDG